MNHFKINPSKLQGKIFLPPSKSQTLRALVFASLAKGKSVIHNYLLSPDTFSMIKACQLLGAKIEVFAKRIEVEGFFEGKITRAEDVIDAGNSGLVLRFCSALSTLSKNPVVITGDHSIRYLRPMKALLSGLSQLGATAISTKGDFFAPVIIQGPLKHHKACIEGADSQPVSSLLIASAFADFPIELNVVNPGETPWVFLTLHWFKKLGISYENRDFKQYRLFGSSRIEGFEYHVPGDLSSLAFPVGAALITKSEITIENVDLTDAQGDKEILNVFQKMGAVFEIDEKNKTLNVKKNSSLCGICVDINNFIDALPLLAVVACFAEGETEIKNAKVAKEKECDRINCIATELKKMGADITETEEGLKIQKSFLSSSKSLYSHQDHRMCMSLCVAAMASEGESWVDSIDCIKKTFPNFAEDFKALGASIYL